MLGWFCKWVAKMNSTECKISEGLRPDTPIYRIFKPEHFFDLIQNKQNTLVIPAKWDDPFENTVLKSKARSESTGEYMTFSHNFRDDVYAQCWTLNPDSNAMWQIYAPAGNGICVQTTVEKLKRNLCCLYLVKKIKYMDEEQLREFFETVFINYVEKHAVAESLSAKRKAYKYEEEVRLMYVGSDKRIPGIHRYDIDPNSLIQSVIIDGRMADKPYHALKSMIMNFTNLQPCQIERSTLYDPPKGLIIKIL